MSISLRLNNVTFSSRKIKGFWENQADMIVESSSLPPKIISCPHFGDASPRFKNRDIAGCTTDCVKRFEYLFQQAYHIVYCPHSHLALTQWRHEHHGCLKRRLTVIICIVHPRGCTAGCMNSSCFIQQVAELAVTHTHPFNGPFLGLPKRASARKVKPISILLKQDTASGSGISWAICKSAPRSRQITMPTPHHSVFFTTNSIKALKAQLAVRIGCKVSVNTVACC